MTRTIRRYGNRKLYDTEESRYVTLAQLGERIRSGDEIVVNSHVDGRDITTETLANIVLAEVQDAREYDRGKLLEMIRASRAAQVQVQPAQPPAQPPPTF